MSKDDFKSEIRSRMEEVMGGFPSSDCKPSLKIKVLEEVAYEGVVRRKISFQTEAQDPQGLCELRAWVLIPKLGTKPAPGMLCLQQTSYAGKDHTIGIKTPYASDTEDLSYALDLAKRGYVTLSPDYPGFGEALPMSYGMGYASMTMKAIWNHSLCLDLLASMEEVDGRKLGAIGHSLGGHNALFLAVFDSRISVVICSCGFTSLERLNSGNISGLSHDRYMPRVATHYGNSVEKMPFDFSDILAAIAPRKILINAPLKDAFDFKGVDDSVRKAEVMARHHSVESSIEVFHPDAGHQFPAEAKATIYSKLDEILFAVA